jgi:thiamine-phosphate pyrophosphorylase
MLNGIHTWKNKKQHKKLKRYIYLISPQNIRGVKFYSKLDQVLKTNKVKYFQLRLKKISTLNLIKIAKKIKRITKKNKVKLLINDNPFVAKAINADGCHIGQKDMNYISSRKILGKKKIIGVTCHNSKELALDAKKIGANYIAFGAFFKSSTKQTAYKANLALLRWSQKKINIPVVAIGGINNSNYKKILSNGAEFIACSGCIWNNKKLDPVLAIENFK